MSRIRGQEETAQLVVGGKLLQGSFAKLESFNWKPRADLPDSDFVGETESEPDFQHHGYDFSFTIHQEDSQAADVYLQIVAAHEAGVVLPDVNFVVIKTFRDPSIPTVTLTFPACKIKLDDETTGGRKDYVKNSFSGKSAKMRKL